MRTESNSFELCNVFYLKGQPFGAIRQNWLLTGGWFVLWLGS